MVKLTPQRIVILSFLCAMVLGAIALSFPIATQEAGGMPFIDSLFTATSATCVTGLIVRDTGTYFTVFGRTVIIVLSQIGGLGIMTFSVLFAVILGRRIGLKEGEIFQNTFGDRSIVGFKKLIAYILSITFLIEAAGALLLYLRWNFITEWSLMKKIEFSVFHSISAFCNSGFALFMNSFEAYRGDIGINIIMMVLIFTGGIGFIVIMDTLGLIMKRPHERKLSLHSKIALATSLILIAVGAVLLFVLEKDHSMRGLSTGESVLASVFQSVTSRTAGFNTLNIGILTTPSLLVIMLLMFIGASPGSTGGGIKTCTFAVVSAYMVHVLRNKKRVMIAGRSLPHKVIQEALVIVFLSAVWIFCCSALLTYFQVRAGNEEVTFIRSLFEVVSAFGTVGLSTGMTSTMDTMSKLCIIATMFAGRVGPLTFAFAVAFKERQEKFVYPEENIMVG